MFASELSNKRRRQNELWANLVQRFLAIRVLILCDLRHLTNLDVRYIVSNFFLTFRNHSHATPVPFVSLFPLYKLFEGQYIHTQLGGFDGVFARKHFKFQTVEFIDISKHQDLSRPVLFMSRSRRLSGVREEQKHGFGRD